MADVITKIISDNDINNGGAVVNHNNTIYSTNPDINNVGIVGVENRLTDRFDNPRYYFWQDTIPQGGFTSGFDDGFG